MTPEKHKPSDLSGMIWRSVMDEKTLQVCALADGSPHHAPVPLRLSDRCRCYMVRKDGGHIPEDKPPDPLYAQRLNLSLHDVELLTRALNKARPFIRRERNHGKHEQDRADATEWLAKYGEG